MVVKQSSQEWWVKGGPWKLLTIQTHPHGKIMDQILLEDLLKHMKHMEDRELIEDSQHGFSKDELTL